MLYVYLIIYILTSKKREKSHHLNCVPIHPITVPLHDPRGNTTTYYYDAGDRLSDIVEPVNDDTGKNRHTHYGYDTRGNKILEEDPNANITTFKYDVLDRLTDKIEPLNKVTKCSGS